MKIFNKDKKYKIGTLIKDEDPLSRNPQFTPRKPAPVILSGKQLADAGCPNLQEFLSKNQYGLPPDRLVHAYEVDEGEYKYFDEGMPVPNNSTQVGLSDNGKGLSFLLPNNDKTADFFERQVKVLTDDKKALEQKLEDERVKLHTRESEWIDKERGFEKKIVELETKVKAYESLIEGVKEGKALSDGGTSWGQILMGVINSPIGSAIGNMIANNPKVQNSVGKILDGVGNAMPSSPEQDGTQELNNPVEDFQ